MSKQRIVLYECGICGSLHPWNWDGDCREDVNRYAGTDDYAERNNVSEKDIDVMSWQDRQDADKGVQS